VSGELEDLLARRLSPTLSITTRTSKPSPIISYGQTRKIRPSRTHEGDRQSRWRWWHGLPIFPGGYPETFWELLPREATPSRNTTGPVDADASMSGAGAAGKMNTRGAGFVKGIDRFDRQLLGISPREADQIDRSSG